MIEQKNILDILNLAGFRISECFRKNQNIYTYNSGCNDKKLGNLRFSAEYVYLNVRSDLIVFNTAILKKFSEEEIITVLAHEIAHYSKHTPVDIIKETDYNYFYKLEEHSNPNTKPVKIDDFQNVAIEASKVERMRMMEYNISGINEASLLPGIVFLSMQPAGNLLFPNFLEGSASQIENAKKNCIDAKAYLTKISEFPFYQSWPQEKLEDYASIASKLKDCLGRKLLTNSNNKKALNNLIQKFPYYIENMSESLNLPTLYDALASLSSTENVMKMIKKENDRILQIQQQVSHKNLGYYTIEQEADEIALEIALASGISIDHFYSFFLSGLQDKKATSFLPGEFNKTDCEEELRKGFPNIIPVLDFEADHHPHCSRIFNLYREFQVHREYYKNLSLESPIYLKDEAKWRSIQSQL